MKRDSFKVIGSAVVLAAAISTPALAQNGAIPTITTSPGGSPATQNGVIPRINGSPNGPLRTMPNGNGGASATTLLVPNAYPDIVRTDPLVRQVQIGAPPVGVLMDVDLTRGVGVANVPGAGIRTVRTVGSPIETAGGRVVRVVDVSTGVELYALMPSTPEPTDPGPLVPAKVVRVTSDGVILEREADGKKVTEILPSQRVYAAVRGGFVPAGSVRRLRAGVEVLIPTTGGPRGTIIVTRSKGFGTRASSASRTAKAAMK